ncbi:cell division protein FtsA [Rhodoligotrophos appendicifer]|uniref:cell division protein FtsA n=1 Tax=Rhodoligotrophos appendicifer TaxID=987056 RepID=UPI0011858B27|nr:cell division protein FtsA [Rhodoligotrophos appendicifer]
MNVVPLHARTNQTRTKPANASPIIAAIDIGSTKICCLIAEVQTTRNKTFGGDKTRQLKILGVGHQATAGIRCGTITDIDKAEIAIRLVVDAAERMSGVSVDQVYVNVSGGRPRCESFTGETRIGGREVAAHDVERAIQVAGERIVAPGRVVLHTTPVQYALDDARGIRDPRGMFGERLSVDLNVVTVEPGPLRNLSLAIERCHLNIAGLVIAPYAAGRSVLVEDEMALGVTCIDMGGGTTSVAVFFEGNLVFADVIPIGGHHITNDIARGLSTPIAHAERMKTLYGSAIPSVCDERELLSVPLVGERGTDTVYKIPRSMLTGIVRPRLEETFELIKQRLNASGFAKLAGRRMVLTGGASQMTGARDLASQILDRHIRLGFPQPMTGMPEAIRTPNFAAVSGLLSYALRPDESTIVLPEAHHSSGYMRRVGRWLRESF